LDSGIKVILLLHSLQCVFYTMMVFLHSYFGVQALGHNIPFWTEVYNAAFALASMPFICCGISGVKYHIELHLRLYLICLAVTCFLDIIFAGIIIFRDVCTNLPAFFSASGSGAFMCGVVRVQSIVLLALLLIFSGYAVFAVWSRCEELRYGLSEESFDGLVAARQYEEYRKLNKLRFGIFGTGPAISAGEPVLYGSAASPLVGGSAPIFGVRHGIKASKEFGDDAGYNAYGIRADGSL